MSFPKWYPPTIPKDAAPGTLPPKFYEGSSKDSIWNKCLMTKAMNKAESEYLTDIANDQHASQKILGKREKVSVALCHRIPTHHFFPITRLDRIQRCNLRPTGAEKLDSKRYCADLITVLCPPRSRQSQKSNFTDVVDNLKGALPHHAVESIPYSW